MSTQFLIGGELTGREQRAVEDRAREACPTHRVPAPTGIDLVVVTVGQELARSLLADPRLSKDSRAINAEQQRQLRAAGRSEELSAMFGPTMLFADNPRHQRLRRLTTAAFTPRRVDDLRPRVVRRAKELVDQLPSGEPVDLVERFAFPLPLTVICELLGVPEADRVDMRRWTEGLMTGDPNDTLPASRELSVYFTELLEAKRAEPDDGLLTALVSARVDGEMLTPAELVGMAILLVVAGHETTTNLLGNTAFELLDRGLWHDVAVQPGLVTAAIEESLRLDPPVRNATHRIATEDISLGDTTIPAGSLVLINISAAGRCPVTTPDRPTEFDLRRPASKHLAFGHGMHFCLGSGLALMEAEVALTQLITRFPRTRLATSGPPLRRSSAIMSGYQSLEVVLS